MAKRFKAAIIGGSGYGGAEMARRLLMHPDVELVRVASIDHVGEPLGAVHPNLDGATDLVFEDLTPAQAAKGCDVALLALPHKVTAAKVPELIAAGVKIVDMSGDFRLRDAATYEKHYGAKHPHPELLGTFVYGLPELNRAEIKKAKHVASPGCFATTIELALLPLARAGMLDGAVVHVTGITGSSGSGIAPGAGTHHPSRAGNLKTYKPLDHQHVPEVVQTLADAGGKGVEIRFVPVSAPLTRGIFAACFIELAGDLDAARLGAMFDEHYAREAFVRRPKKRLPEVVAVAGSNYAEVGFALGPVVGGRRTVTCFAAIDNLIKGGAGQAIQNMNLVLGCDEKASLEDLGELAVTPPVRPIVVKIGGEVIGSGEAAALAADLRVLVDAGARVAIVHGGGPQATELSKQLGIKTTQIAGRRFTDAATLDVMKMIVAGKLNVDLCATLVAAGLSPVGLHGASAQTVRAVKRPPRVYQGAGSDPVDLGLVGDVTGFNLPLLVTLWSAGHVPVIACIGADAEGGVYNINADIVGNQLAAAVSAERLFLVTSAPGVLKNIDDPSSRLTRLDCAAARAAIADGTVTGGMIAKLEEAMSVIDAGVGAIHIVGKLAAGDLVRAVREPGSVGTTLVA